MGSTTKRNKNKQREFVLKTKSKRDMVLQKSQIKDVEYAVKWLISQDWVDNSRIGIFGRSFGGFEVLSCISRLPQYWRAAVDVFGPSL